MSSPSITLTCPLTPFNRNKKIVCLVNLANFNQQTINNIKSIALWVNDENVHGQTSGLSTLQKISISETLYNTLDVWNNNSLTINKSITTVVAGRQYTVRCLLELLDGTIYQSAAVNNVQVYDVPVQPIFNLRPSEVVDPLDVKFGFYIENINDYSNSYLTDIKFIWSTVVNGSGTLDIMTYPINQDNLYIIDVSNTFFMQYSSNIYEVSCIVQNFAGESIVSETKIYNATNIPDQPTNFSVKNDQNLSDGNSVRVDISFNPASELGTEYNTYVVYYKSYEIGQSEPVIDKHVDSFLPLVIDSSNGNTIFGHVDIPTSDVPELDSLYLKQVTLALKPISASEVDGILSQQQSIYPGSTNAKALTVEDVKVGPLTSNYERAFSQENSDLTEGSGEAYLFVNNPNSVIRGYQNTYNSIGYVIDGNGNNLNIALVYQYNDVWVIKLTGLTNFTTLSNVRISVKTNVSDGIGQVNSNELSSGVEFMPFTYSTVPIIIANAYDTSITLTLTQFPISNGYYQFELNGNQNWQGFTFDNNSYTITDLTNGSDYGIKVRTVVEINSGDITYSYFSNGVRIKPTSSGFNNLITPIYVPNGNSNISSYADVNLVSYVGPRNINANVVTLVSEPEPVTDNGNGSVTIVWNEPTDSELGITGKVIFKEYQIKLDGSLLHTISSKSSTIYTLSNLSNGVSYNIEIKAITQVDPTIDTTQFPNIKYYGPDNDVILFNSSVASSVPFTWPSAPVYGNNFTEESNKVSVYLTNIPNHPQYNFNTNNVFIQYRYKNVDSQEYTVWSDYEINNNNNQYIDINNLDNGTSYNIELRAVVTIDGVTYVSYKVSNVPVLTAIDDLDFISSLVAYAGPRNSNNISITEKSNIGSNNNGNQNVSLEWESISINNSNLNFVDYKVEKSTDNVNWTFVSNVNSTNLNVSSLQNGVTYYFRVSANYVSASTGANLVYYGDNVVNIIPFTFVDDISSVQSEAGTQELDLSWVSNQVHDSYSVYYSLDVSVNGSFLNVVDQLEDTNYLLLVVNNSLLVNGVRYSGRVTPYIIVNGDRYNSNSTSWTGVPYTNPDAPIFSVQELDQSFNISISNADNQPSGYTLDYYDIKVKQTSDDIVVWYDVSFVPDLSQNIENVIVTGLVNGTSYYIEIKGHYTTDGGDNVSSLLGSLINLVPFGRPIIDPSVTQFYRTSGSVVIRVDPNGRQLEKLLIVAIPNKIVNDGNNNLSYVFEIDSFDNSNLLSTSIVGYETITLVNDPFGYSVAQDASLELDKGYVFATNLAGASKYEETGSV
jgi:hypothetical protein